MYVPGTVPFSFQVGFCHQSLLPHPDPTVGHSGAGQLRGCEGTTCATSIGCVWCFAGRFATGSCNLLEGGAANVRLHTFLDPRLPSPTPPSVPYLDHGPLPFGWPSTLIVTLTLARVDNDPLSLTPIYAHRTWTSFTVGCLFLTRSGLPTDPFRPTDPVPFRPTAPETRGVGRARSLYATPLSPPPPPRVLKDSGVGAIAPTAPKHLEEGC